MRKKLFALALALVMCLGMTPASALTGQEYSAALAFTFDGALGSVVMVTPTGSDYVPSGWNPQIDHGDTVSLYAHPATGCTLSSMRLVRADNRSVVVKNATADGTLIFQMPTYDCVVEVVFLPGAPTITAHPQGASCAAGSAAVFSVTAEGKGELSYQWYCGFTEIFQKAEESPFTITGGQTPAMTITPAAGLEGLHVYCVVSNAGGSAKSMEALLTVTAASAAVAPGIKVQPRAATAAEGGTVRFSVAAEGTTPMTFRWYGVPAGSAGKAADGTALRDTLSGKTPAGKVTAPAGPAISGAATATLTLTGVTAALSGSRYYCVVTNAAGSDTSSPALLTVTATTAAVAAPVIAAHPQDVTVNEGEPISASVTATGEDLHYEWKMVDAGATTVFNVDSPTFTLTEHAEKAVHSSYWLWCRVWNAGGSVESEKAWIWVNIPGAPVIVTQPQSVTVEEGEPFSFSVTATGENLHYRWTVYQGDDSETFFDAVADTPTINYADWAVYDTHNGLMAECYIFNELGDVTSEVMTVTVTRRAERADFTDIRAENWFYSDVKNAVKLGLVSGTGDGTTYSPNDNLTVASAIKLAACMHQKYHTGAVTLQNGSPKWYSSYVAYAEANGIAAADEYAARLDAPATRAEFLKIFYAALPAGEYTAVNTVQDGAIPDMKPGDALGKLAYAFYRAGILTGSDARGTFNPDKNIQRSEVAAILSRMMDKGARRFLVLPAPELGAVPVPSCWTAADGNFVFFTTRGGLAAVEYGTWDLTARRGHGAGYVASAARSGDTLTLTLLFPPVPDPADEQDTRSYTDTLTLDLSGLEQDGKLRVRVNSGAWYQYANGGATYQAAYDSVH